MIEDSLLPFPVGALLFFGVVCTYIGIWIGRSIEAYRWRTNKCIYINSGGKLYKVKEVG